MTSHTLFTKIIEQQSNITKDSLKDVLDRFNLKKIKNKNYIVREGSVCKEFFFINDGMIRTFVNHDGNEVTTWVALPGTIETAAESFIRQTPSLVNLQSITDCEVLVMNRDNYYHLIRSNEAFNNFAFHMLENFYLRVEDKFHSYLFLSAEERLRKMQAQFPDHFEQVPLKYLASILRIQPETLSRLRKSYKS